MAGNWRSKLFSRLLLICAAALLIGWIIGHPGWTLSAALAAYIAWMLFQTYRLATWLLDQEHQDNAPPECYGIWGEIFDGIYRIQRRQKRSRKRLLAIIERIQDSTTALNDAVVMLDNKGNLDWWNRASERLLSFREPDDRKHPVTHLIRHPGFVQYFESQHYEEPLELRSPVDESRWLQFSITLFGKGERLMVCRDITRLKNLEEMRKDFVANVSHELRTPLTVIRGYLETMLDHVEIMPDGARWQRPLQQMQQQSERMGGLVSDLLLLSRLEAGEQQAESEPVVLEPMLQNIIEDAHKLAGENHRFELQVGANSRLKGNEKELHSAFSNLVVNAVKYSPDGGTIKIRWREDQTGGHLTVEDEGTGIDPVHIPRLTERFYRVDKSRSIDTGGTGLGLAIVKHVLLRHQGYLSIVSHPGQGSSFTCHFQQERLGSA